MVAFSGGKDSLALLNLVSRALSPNEFVVVFSNTGMELSTTIQSVEKAKRHWSSLKFYEAKSHLDPTDSWEEFGPPGKRMRWCCAVHKSVPTILLLREITGNYNVKAVVFDGVRAEESAARADRDEISVGAKNINQVNCSPILKWNSSELFLYLLHYRILLNDAYRIGFNRVGCTICPLSSGWRTRMGGRGLKNGGNRVIEKIDNDKLTFSFREKPQHWLDMCPILGPTVYHEENVYAQIINKQQFKFMIENESVSYWPYSKMDRFVLSHLRGVANKTAYCFGCKACEVECPVNAFTITGENEIYIRAEKMHPLLQLH